MKIWLSQLFFMLSQPKLYAHFKILFSLIFFKEGIVILYFMYCFWRNTPTYLPTYLPMHYFWQIKDHISVRKHVETRLITIFFNLLFDL